MKKIYPKNHTGSNFIRELCEKPAFRETIEKFRDKWVIDVFNEIHFLVDVYKPNLTKQSKLLKNKNFVADVRKLQAQFKLGEEWSSFMNEYIFIDELSYPKESNLFIEKRIGKDGDTITGRPAFYLRIFPETTQNDIVKSWEEINEFINGTKVKTKRQKISKTFERDRAIYLMAKDNFCIERIQQSIEEYYSSKIDYLAIKTAERRYRKFMGIKESSNLHYRNDFRKNKRKNK